MANNNVSVKYIYPFYILCNFIYNIFIKKTLIWLSKYKFNLGRLSMVIKHNPVEGLNTEEYLDLVDEIDNVIGSMSRTEVYKKQLSNFRVINAFLKNSKGQLWIPQRTKTKRLFPLHLDVSVGGHVSSGENYEQSFIRELAEELNINALDVNYKEIAYLNPKDHHVSAFMKVYEIQAEQAPNFNTNDFIKGNWMLPKDVIDILNNNVLGKPDLLKLLKLLYI